MRSMWFPYQQICSYPTGNRHLRIVRRNCIFCEMSAMGTPTVPDLRAEVLEGTKRVRIRIRETLEEWFGVCDHILDVHRTRFLMREPTARKLEEHKAGV